MRHNMRCAVNLFKNNIKSLSVLLILACLPAAAQDVPEIRIQLATENSLAPIHVKEFQSADSSFSASYLRQLDAVFRFDMNYNGYTVPVSADTRAVYTLSGNVKAKKLTLSILQGNQSKQYKDIPLSGSLDIDRRQIHKLSDLIVKNLFGREGVASSKLLFAIQAQQDNNWISEIWQSDWDGGNLTQITKEKSYCVSPAFIPAKAGHISNRFIYVSYKLGQPKIYLASTDEGKGRRIVDLKGNQLLPTVSPNRNKIAFICDAAGRTDLFIQSINPEQGEMGKPVQLFSYPRSTQASPTFSPDGSQIAFVSDKDGSPRIYVIPTQVKKQRPQATLITKKNSESSCPSWSPDGTKLAYSAKTKGVRQIWIYDFNAGEERQLTDGPGNKENPCWASDSMHMVFNSTDASSSEIFLVNLNQPDAVKITSGGGKKHYPTWSQL